MARARGVRLGNPNGAGALRRAGKGGASLRAAIVCADRHAKDLASVIADVRAAGAVSLRAIAEELKGRGMLTRRGGRWHVSTVADLLDRLGEAGCGAVGRADHGATRSAKWRSATVQASRDTHDIGQNAVPAVREAT
jgi:hypothetical protein